MAYSEASAGTDHLVFDEYVHLIEVDAGGFGGPFDPNRDRRHWKKNEPKRKRNHSSIQIWGGGRFYDWSDIEYLGGQVKYVHQCDLNSFGLWDLIGAATECKFTSGQPTMDWYLHPDGGNTIEDLIPLIKDHDVRTMLLLGNNFRKPFVTVYTQDTNFLTSPGLGGGKYYVIPPSIPTVKTAGLMVEVKYNVLDRLSVRLTLTKEEQGLEETLGKILYISCKSVTEPPCQKPTPAIALSRIER